MEKSPKVKKMKENMPSKKRKSEAVDTDSTTSVKKKAKSDDFTVVEFAFKIKDADTSLDGNTLFY